MKMDDVVLLKTEHKGKIKELIVSVSDGQLHTEFGIIELEDLIDKEFGDFISSHKGQEYVIQKPRMPDLFKHAKRTGAPMMPKDIGAIIGHTGLNKDDTVLDSGTGSGILAMYLGSVAKKVVSYEVREEFIKVARRNIEMAGLNNIEVRCGNIVDAIKELDEGFDVITLDTIDSKDVIPHVRNVLLPGGFVVTYSPFMEQAKEIRDALKKADAFEANTFEFTEREISFSERGTRPSTTRVGHTGYITIARF